MRKGLFRVVFPYTVQAIMSMWRDMDSWKQEAPLVMALHLSCSRTVDLVSHREVVVVSLDLTSSSSTSFWLSVALTYPTRQPSWNRFCNVHTDVALFLISNLLNYYFSVHYLCYFTLNNVTSCATAVALLGYLYMLPVLGHNASLWRSRFWVMASGFLFSQCR